MVYNSTSGCSLAALLILFRRSISRRSTIISCRGGFSRKREKERGRFGRGGHRMWDMQTTRRVGFLVRCTRTGSPRRGEAVLWLERGELETVMVDGQIVDRTANTRWLGRRAKSCKASRIGIGTSTKMYIISKMFNRTNSL